MPCKVLVAPAKVLPPLSASVLTLAPVLVAAAGASAAKRRAARLSGLVCDLQTVCRREKRRFAHSWALQILAGQPLGRKTRLRFAPCCPARTARFCSSWPESQQALSAGGTCCRCGAFGRWRLAGGQGSGWRGRG